MQKNACYSTQLKIRPGILLSLNLAGRDSVVRCVTIRSERHVLHERGKRNHPLTDWEVSIGVKGNSLKLDILLQVTGIQRGLADIQVNTHGDR